MKPITKKLLQAGLVNEDFAKMLERWGSLQPGELEQVKILRLSLKDLIDDLDSLLDPKEDIKETKFQIVIKEPPIQLYSHFTGPFSAVSDEMGRFIVSPSIRLNPGDCIWVFNNDELPDFVVLTVESLYSGNNVVAKQVTVKVNKDVLV